MARLLALCSLPRTNPGDRREYVRHNGPYTLTMTVNGNAKLPYGNIPRLLLAWVCTEAVRTQRRELVLGRSLYEFMRKLGMENRSGGINGERTRLKNQMRRLFRCSVQLVYVEAQHEVIVQSFIADRAEFWWDATRDSGPSLWDSTIELGEKFFHEIIAHPVPIDMNILRSLKRSPLGLDLLPLAHVPNVQSQDAAVPVLAADLPTIWCGSVARDGRTRVRREPLPGGLFARAEKNKTRLAGPVLSHRHGWARHRSLAAVHPAGTAPSH